MLNPIASSTVISAAKAAAKLAITRRS